MRFKFVVASLVLSAIGWAAEISKPNDAPAPRSPGETAASYRLPEGFRLEVVASEPLIASPSGVCWDERGRMFVSELHGYNLEGQLDIEALNKTGQLDTKVRRVQASEEFKRAAEPGTYGVVKLLRDTNGDRRMDAAEVWTTNIPPAYGLVAARGGVIVACAPHILFLADRDGDGRAEVQEKLFTGFRTGALERGINAPQWGVDGWIYFGRGWGGGEITGPMLAKSVRLPNVDFRIRADGTAIEPVTGATHTFGFAMTEAGDRFVATTTVPGIFVAPLPWRYLTRNPDAAFANLEAPTGDRRAYSISKPHPWRQKRADDPAYFEFYRSRYGPAESEADGWFTAACGPMVYQDHVLPGLHGQYFVCEPSGNLIHRAEIKAEGAGFKLQRIAVEEKSEFAASSDTWTHPMHLTHGPDGSIWIVDYYREIIEDYSAIPRRLQQQYGVYNGHDRGRIYRLTHRDAAVFPAQDLSALTSDELGHACASPLLWRRLTAQRLLVERGSKSSATALRGNCLAADAKSTSVITSLQALSQLDELKADDVRAFLNNPNAAVRVHALQLSERWLKTGESRELADAAFSLVAKESDARVLIQLALSIGESNDPRAFGLLAQLARQYSQTRWMDAALISSLQGRVSEMLDELTARPGATESFLAELKKVAAAVVKKGVASRAVPDVEKLPPIEQINEATIEKYKAALKGKRELERGREVFVQACATCHRVGQLGHEVGPDLVGQIGMPEESLLRDVLAPNEKIRPGFETTVALTADGTTVMGILKEDGPTSVTLGQANVPQTTILRKDISNIRRAPNSLMPGFAETLSPDDVANLLAWLRTHLAATK